MDTPRIKPSVGVALALILWTLAGLGCAASSHGTTDATLGTVVASQALLEPGEGATVSLSRVVAADWAVDRSGLINLDHPEARAAGLEDGLEPIQIYFYVIEHPTQGRFIVDTGVAEAFRQEDTAPVSGMVASAMNFEALEVQIDTKTWLAEHGPIQGVFLTHLHLDHIMGLPDVPHDVPIYSGPGEASASAFLHMFVQGTADGLLDGFGPLHEWAFEADPSGRLDGVLDVFGDGSVYAIHAPGHTPGSTAYFVRTPEGPVLITGDACHTRFGWEHQVEPGTFNLDGERSAVSLGRLESLAREVPGLVVYLGHQSVGSGVAAR